MDDAKIYGLCITRLNHQVENARKTERTGGKDNGVLCRRILLESYMTSEVEEVIDILELYDIEGHTQQHLARMLRDLAYTASLLTRENLSFGFTEEGHLGLYLELKGICLDRSEEDALVSAEILS